MPNASAIEKTQKIVDYWNSRGLDHDTTKPVLYDDEYFIENDGSLTITKRASDIFEIFDFMLDENGELTVPLYKCGSIVINTSEISSFKNFPEIFISDSFNKIHFHSTNPALITSLEGLTLDNSKFDLIFTPLLFVNLSNCHKHIKSCSTIYLPASYSNAILSVLLIKNLKNIKVLFGGNSYEYIKIVNKHLHSGRDVLECQEELIQNGLRVYAKL